MSPSMPPTLPTSARWQTKYLSPLHALHSQLQQSLQQTWMKVSTQDGPAKVTLKLMWPRTGSVVVEVVEAVGVVKVQGVVGQVPVEVAEEMVVVGVVKIMDQTLEANAMSPTLHGTRVELIGSILTKHGNVNHP